jgi:hypothetical protein
MRLPPPHPLGVYYCTSDDATWPKSYMISNLLLIDLYVRF